VTVSRDATISQDDFRAAMACRASAVSIVTSRSADKIHGMTVSDFAGVSLDPPLVLVCADKASITTGVITEGKCFAINILAEGQEALSNRFASKKDEFRRFEGLEIAEGSTGAPLIPSAIASLDCQLVASHDAGDHLICVGSVVDVRIRDRAPLIHFRGRYARLGEGRDE
jgi:4-nitrophenol 2-monooxygenase / 4-nitrocatechol 4-monooxygenase, reductase component